MGCIRKNIIIVFFVFSPIVWVALEAQKPTEQELYQDGSMTGILEEEFLIKYGPDQRLINGVGYYNRHAQSTGHKFLGEDKYRLGRLTIDNRLYKDLLLKYDIYNQQVILLFSQEGSRNKEILINDIKLEGFQLGNLIFKKYYFPETDTLIFQVFEGEKVSFLYHWKKNLIPIVSGNSLSEFSKPKRTSFVQIASGLFEFKNNGTFLKIFPGQRSELKKFLKSRRINLRSASERQIRELNDYCNQIIDQKPASE